METQQDRAEAALPPHTGLFREETSLLRELFGFTRDNVSTTVSQLGDLQIGEGLSSTSIKDVVFVAIDVDTLQGIRGDWSGQAAPSRNLHS
jgi:hypothetical protein